MVGTGLDCRYRLGRRRCRGRRSSRCLISCEGGGWVLIGSSYSIDGTPGSLDAHLKTCLKTATAGWIAVVLEKARVITVDRTRPARIELRPGWQPQGLEEGPDLRGWANELY